MAGSPIAQRRQRWIERQIGSRCRDEYPDLYALLRARAAAEYDSNTTRPPLLPAPPRPSGPRPRPALVEARFQFFGHRCYLCGRSADVVGTLARDHVLPRSKGHPDLPANIRPACRSCNCSKRASTLPAAVLRVRVTRLRPGWA